MDTNCNSYQYLQIDLLKQELQTGPQAKSSLPSIFVRPRNKNGFYIFEWLNQKQKKNILQYVKLNEFVSLSLNKILLEYHHTYSFTNYL